MIISRRHTLAMGALGLLASRTALGASAAPATPPEQMGPFYPVTSEGENVADLTRIGGQTERAKGPAIEIAGRVLDRTGTPIGGAMVLIWQANAAGRYDHPRNYFDAPHDPAFRGHALIRTAQDGTFRLISVKPGSYPDGMGADGWRTPHIHYEVIGEEGRLVTQMYFPDEPRNDADFLLSAMRREGRDAAALIAKKAKAPRDGGAETFTWDIVLEKR